jgi:predicted Zn finger-like uncharacterized protein
MFTVCPKCTLTLAITAADLRAGQGYVRCGRCANVFNALLELSEEPAEGAAAAHSAEATASRPSPFAPTDPEPAHDGELGTGPDTAGGSDSSIESDSSNAIGTGSYETIVLEGDGILQTEEFLPEETIDEQIAALSERFDAANAAADLSEAIDAARANDAASRAAGTTPADNTDTPDAAGAADAAGERVAARSRDTALQEDARALLESIGANKAEAPPRRRWPWIVGSIALALLLAAQAVHHWRNDLAVRPAWNRPLSRIYAAIGVPLEPRWDLSAYDVRQQGAETDAASGTIRVRLSLANHARRAQPWPILRLTLLDRYGKRVAARDLTPPEYLPNGRAGAGFLAADARIDTQVAVRDPGADTSSFEIDVCLRAAALLRCASDATESPQN